MLILPPTVYFVFKTKPKTFPKVSFDFDITPMVGFVFDTNPKTLPQDAFYP